MLITEIDISNNESEVEGWIEYFSCLNQSNEKWEFPLSLNDIDKIIAETSVIDGCVKEGI